MRETVGILQVDEIRIVVQILRLNSAEVVAGAQAKPAVCRTLLIQALEQLDCHIEILALILIDDVRLSEIVHSASIRAQLANDTAAIHIGRAERLPLKRIGPVTADHAAIPLARHKIRSRSSSTLDRALVNIRLRILQITSRLTHRNIIRNEQMLTHATFDGPILIDSKSINATSQNTDV